MAIFNDIRNSRKELRTEISVACPHCGRTADFSYGLKLPEAEELICSFCGTDLRRAFLHEALEEQLRLHKKVRLKLGIYLAVTALSLIMLLVYVSQNQGMWWLWFIIVVNIVLVLGGLVLMLRNNRFLCQIKQKKSQFDL